MILKKLLLILLIVLLNITGTYAYTSEEYITIYYNGNTARQDIYIVPDGKDLLIQYMYSDSLVSADLGIRDNGVDITFGSFTKEIYDVNFIITDTLQLIDSNASNHYTLTGILVNEGEDIKAIIDGNEYGINKPIFNEEVLKEIYLYESVIMMFIILMTFFARLYGFKAKKKSKIF